MAIPEEKNTLYIQRGLTRKRSIIMGIDLTKLEMMRKAALLVDENYGNSNKKLEKGIETTIFEGKIAEFKAKGIVSQEEIDLFYQLGYADSLTKTGTSTDPISKESGEEVRLVKKEEKGEKGVSKKQARKDTSAREGLVLRYLNTIVDNGDDITKGLADSLGTLKNTPEYEDLYGQVKYILNNVNETYANMLADSKKTDHKDIINDLEKAVKKNLYIKRRDKFAQDVLELLVKNAEQEQMAKEYNEVKEAFMNEYNKGGKTLSETLSAVKEQFKGKGSYYKEILKDFSKDFVSRLGDNIAMDVIDETEGEKWRKVRKRANKELKETGLFDKYTKIRREIIAKANGNESNVRIAVDNQARKNKVENRKEQSKEEILKTLKNKTDVFDALVAAGLITKKENGNYDLSVLSDVILNEVGSDRYLDKMSKKYQAIGEKLGTSTELKVQTNLNDLSDKEIEQLIKLCGFTIEKKNWGSVAMKTILGALLGGISAGGAEAARRNPTYRHHDENHLKSTLHIDSSDKDAYSYEVFLNGQKIDTGDNNPFDINIPEGAEGAKVVIDIATNLDIIKDIAFRGGKFVLSNALRGAVIGGAIGLLDGVITDDSSEIPVAEINFDDMSYAKYMERVEKKFPKWANALSAIALTFHDENGNWDCEGYRAFLRKAAGNDILNKKELVAALREDRKMPEPVKVVEPPKNKEKEEVPEVCLLEKDENSVDTTLTHKIQYGDSWEELVKAYFPTWKNCFGKMYGKGGAIQALKEALANGDKNLYNKLLSGYIPSEINIPERLGDCKRNDDGKVQFKQPVGTPKGYMGKVGIETGYNEVTLTDCNGKTAKGANVDEAITNFNKQHKTEYTKEDVI